jgi:hypothetical protein
MHLGPTEARDMLGPRCLFIAVLLTSGLLGGELAAQDIDCLKSFGNVELDGNLNIAVRCQLTGTEVNGNVRLFAGGSLVARDATILGNLEGNRANFVDIEDSFIEGNLRLEEFVGDESTIQNSDIHGNATLSSNRSRLEMLNNDLDGSLKVTHNTGGVVIAGNSIGRNLDCNGNKPAPVGFGNRVDGDTKGQCRNLGQDSGDEEDDEEEEEEEEEGDEPAPPPTPTTPPPTTSPTPTTSPPRGSSPTPSEPPASPAAPPAPTTSVPPATSTPPATSAPPTTPAPPAPTTAAQPAAPPAAAAPPTATNLVEDDGGAGAFGWFVALLLPLLAWRRFARRRTQG